MQSVQFDCITVLFPSTISAPCKVSFYVLCFPIELLPLRLVLSQFDACLTFSGRVLFHVLAATVHNQHGMWLAVSSATLPRLSGENWHRLITPVNDSRKKHDTSRWGNENQTDYGSERRSTLSLFVILWQTSHSLWQWQHTEASLSSLKSVNSPYKITLGFSYSSSCYMDVNLDQKHYYSEQ